jgi:ribosomal RNA small subunit methyltransferase A
MEIRELLLSIGLNPSKRFGQNFLVDNALACEISHLIRQGAAVLEVGAGTGALTERIIEKANQMIVFESNQILANYLTRKFGSKALVRAEDFLKAKVPTTDIIVSSVPYTISLPFMIKLFDLNDKWNEAILILQEEFVQKLCAIVGAPNYRRISVLAQYAWKIERLNTISKKSFYPEPRVNSALVRLVPNKNVDVVTANKLKVFTNTVFNYRKRTLRAALKFANLSWKNKLENTLDNHVLRTRVNRLDVPTFEKIIALL